MTCRGDLRSPQGGHHAGKSNAADGKKDQQIIAGIYGTPHYGVNVAGQERYKEWMQKGRERVKDLGVVLGPLHPVVAENIDVLKSIGAAGGETKTRVDRSSSRSGPTWWCMARPWPAACPSARCAAGRISCNAPIPAIPCAWPIRPCQNPNFGARKANPSFPHPSPSFPHPSPSFPHPPPSFPHPSPSFPHPSPSFPHPPPSFPHPSPSFPHPSPSFPHPSPSTPLRHSRIPLRQRESRGPGGVPTRRFPTPPRLDSRFRGNDDFGGSVPRWDGPGLGGPLDVLRVLRKLLRRLQGHPGRPTTSRLLPGAVASGGLSGSQPMLFLAR